MLVFVLYSESCNVASMAEDEHNNVIGIERARRNEPLDEPKAEGFRAGIFAEVLPEAVDSADHVLGWVLGRLGQQIDMDEVDANRLGIVVVVNTPAAEVSWATTLKREQSVRNALAQALAALPAAEAPR